MKKSCMQGYKNHVPVKGTVCDEMNILWPNDSKRFVWLGNKFLNLKFDQNMLTIEWDISSKINLGTTVKSLDTRV